MKHVSKWKRVEIDPNMFAEGKLDGLISFEELQDYNIFRKDPEQDAKDKTQKGKVKKKKKNKKKSTDGTSHLPKSGELPKPHKKKGKVLIQQKVIDVTESLANVDRTEPLEPDSDLDDFDVNTGKIKAKKRKKKQGESGAEGPASKKKKKNKKKKKASQEKPAEHKETIEHINPAEILAANDMGAWKNLFVPEPVLAALVVSGFTAPTPIQALTLPSAIRDKKDIVGAAETGSGKTLAFGIPIIHSVLKLREQLAKEMEEEEENVESDSDVDPGDSAAAVEELDTSGLSLPDDGGMEQSEGEESGSEDIDDEEDFDLELLQQRLKEQESSDIESEVDLPPTEEELDEIDDEELGCLHVENDAFDWPEEESQLPAKSASKKPTSSNPLLALVLCPTRELAIQVQNHLKAAAKFTDIQVAAVVGGMAAQKQERLLRKHPEIVVATPGRLWELIQEGQPHLATADKVRLLVVDEADRMVEKGHFQELQTLFEWMNDDLKNKKQRQNFIFSATLTFVPTGVKKHTMKKSKEMTPQQKLESLMSQIGIRDKPKVVDLTQKAGTAQTLVESRINCSQEEKDMYLYYFLQQYPGRTLVFTNSKDCIRRLVSIFTLLQCCPLPLHSDMHQRQRLKNLDRFKGNPKGLLLATDVAARGLDIPDVQHVIHYQVPRTTENYVHRSGRTARASKEGLSVMLVGQSDVKDYRKICKMLNREEVPVFPVETDYLPAVRARVNLAQTADKLQLRMVKVKKSNSWFEKAAKEMDIELDEDRLLEDEGDSRQQAESRDQITALKAQLNALLKQPLLTRSYSGKYITQAGKIKLPYLKEHAPGGAITAIKQDIASNQSSVIRTPALKKSKASKSKFKRRRKK